MEDDAKLRQAWIDWINAQYTLADRLLTPSLVGSPVGNGGGALSELPLGAAELVDRRRKGPEDTSAQPRKRD